MTLLYADWCGKSLINALFQRPGNLKITKFSYLPWSTTSWDSYVSRDWIDFQMSRWSFYSPLLSAQLNFRGIVSFWKLTPFLFLPFLREKWLLKNPPENSQLGKGRFWIQLEYFKETYSIALDANKESTLDYLETGEFFSFWWFSLFKISDNLNIDLISDGDLHE